MMIITTGQGQDQEIITGHGPAQARIVEATSLWWVTWLFQRSSEPANRV